MIQLLGERTYYKILAMCVNKNITIDTFICYHIYKYNKVSIFPIISKVKNYGHDGRGEHGSINKIFLEQKIDLQNTNLEYITENIKNDEIQKLLQKYFKISLKEKFKKKIKNLIY